MLTICCIRNSWSQLGLLLIAILLLLKNCDTISLLHIVWLISFLTHSHISCYCPILLNLKFNYCSKGKSPMCILDTLKHWQYLVLHICIPPYMWIREYSAIQYEFYNLHIQINNLNLNPFSHQTHTALQCNQCPKQVQYYSPPYGRIKSRIRKGYHRILTSSSVWSGKR